MTPLSPTTASTRSKARARTRGAINGIQLFGGDPAPESIVVHGKTVTGLPNKLDDDAVGGVASIKLQASLDGVSVTGNTLTDLHSAGWAWDVVLTSSESHPDVPQDVVVEGNTMDRLNDGTEYAVFEGGNAGRDQAPYPGSAFGLDGEASAAEVTSLTDNNLLAPNGAESKDDDNALDATCNWWGDDSGPTHDDNSTGRVAQVLAPQRRQPSIGPCAPISAGMSPPRHRV